MVRIKRISLAVEGLARADAVAKLVAPIWMVGTTLAMLPALVLSLPILVPIMLLDRRLERHPRMNRVAVVLLGYPAVALFVIGRILGWACLAWFLWLQATHAEDRKALSSALKFFATIPIAGGVIALLNAARLPFSSSSRRPQWLPDPIARFLFYSIATALLVAILGILTYLGIL